MTLMTAGRSRFAPRVSSHAELVNLPHDVADKATLRPLLDMTVDIVAMPGSSTVSRYRSLRWPRVPSSPISPAAAKAGPLGEGWMAEGSDADRQDSDSGGGEDPRLTTAATFTDVQVFTNAPAPLPPEESLFDPAVEMSHLAMRPGTGSELLKPPGHPGGGSRELEVIASLISEYERMVRESKVALGQLKAWSAFCCGAIKLVHPEDDPQEQQRTNLLFAMVMANNYAELRKAGVSL